MYRKATKNYALDRRRSLRIALALGLVGLSPLSYAQEEDDEDDE